MRIKKDVTLRDGKLRHNWNNQRNGLFAQHLKRCFGGYECLSVVKVVRYMPNYLPDELSYMTAFPKHQHPHQKASARS